MKFGKALKLLKKGEPITRPCWHDSGIILVNGDLKAIARRDWQPYSVWPIHPEDWLAEDWTILKK